MRAEDGRWRKTPFSNSNFHFPMSKIPVYQGEMRQWRLVRLVRHFFISLVESDS
jgi:hypothetical protein